VIGEDTWDITSIRGSTEIIIKLVIAEIAAKRDSNAEYEKDSGKINTLRQEIMEKGVQHGHLEMQKLRIYQRRTLQAAKMPAMPGKGRL
jgi:hypothetical protein